MAAANPHAWFRRERSPDELIHVSSENRLVAHPYPKNLVAIMDVDMASGLLIASHEKAEALGVPQDRRIYLRGWCEAKDPLYVAERDQLWRSIAMQEASQAAMSAAGIGIDEIAHLDLLQLLSEFGEFCSGCPGSGRWTIHAHLTVTGGLPVSRGSRERLSGSFHRDPGRNGCGKIPRAYGMTSGVGNAHDQPFLRGLQRRTGPPWAVLSPASFKRGSTRLRAARSGPRLRGPGASGRLFGGPWP